MSDNEPEVGQVAPDFTLPSTQGGELTLSSLRGKKVVLAWHVLDFTSGWIIEYSSFKGEYKKFQALGAEILGISVDHIYAHNVFAASLGGLPFPLLADWSRKVTRQYGVFDEELERPRRSIFVLDKDGVVRHKNTSYDTRSPRQYQEILDILAKI